MSRSADPERPVTAPDFLLSRATGSLRTIGAKQGYDDPADAALALRAGRADLVVGAIGFEEDSPAALVEPEIITVTHGPLEPPAYFRRGAVPARISEAVPEPEEHLDRIHTALAGIRAGTLEKVVLARALRLEAIDPERPFDPHVIAARFIDLSPSANGFYADLSAAGGLHRGRILVGSSPELLVRRQGRRIECHPLAGSAARSSDPAVDENTARALRDSAKDIAEHQFVVDAIVSALSPLCTALEVPSSPEVSSTREMWHLGSRITGQLSDPKVSALDLAMALHPTPAVGGTPVRLARDVIAGLEGRREFYAGAVGWANATGDGEWMVTIRCAEIDAARTTAMIWAGGGLVDGSDPREELAETEAKFRTGLTAFGL